MSFDRLQTCMMVVMVEVVVMAAVVVPVVVVVVGTPISAPRPQRG